MNIQMAHLRTQGISFAVFAADARTPTASARDQLLARLTAKARLLGMCVDKAALCYRSCGRVEFYGTPDLVRYLSSSGVPRWTHTIAA